MVMVWSSRDCTQSSCMHVADFFYLYQAIQSYILSVKKGSILDVTQNGKEDIFCSRIMGNQWQSQNQAKIIDFQALVPPTLWQEYPYHLLFFLQFSIKTL